MTQKPLGKTKYYCSNKGKKSSTKMTPNDTLQCLAQLSSEKLLPVRDGNKYIIYIQTICRLKDPGRFSLIWVFLSNPFPQISENPAE